MIVVQIRRARIVHMDEQPTTDDEIRAFVARKVGELQADIAKLIATLNFLAPPQRVRQYRRMTLLIVVWLTILTIVLIGHALLSADLLRG